MQNQDITTLREIIKTLHALCQMKFPGLIRLSTLPGKGIKFTLKDLNISGVPSLTFGEISPKGLEMLPVNKEIDVEIAGLKQRLKFRCMVMSIGEGQVVASVPAVLSVEERRLSTRYQTTPHQPAFINIVDFKFDGENVIHPPVFALHQKLAGWMMVRNISQTGVLMEAVFPGLFNHIAEVNREFPAQIILAGVSPLELTCQTRWFKRIRETIQESDHGEARSQHRFHIGCRFVDPGETLEVAVAGYINQLNVSSTI